MIIENELEKYVIHHDATVQKAASLIAHNKGRILFGVDHHNHLVGVLTNGDLIRWLSKSEPIIDVNESVSAILNTEFICHKEGDPAENIENYLEKVLFVPIVDSQNHLVAIARRRAHDDNRITIAGRRISDDDPVYIIAEIGNNHNGDLNRAFRLISAAADAGADAVKFQMRDMRSLYHNSGDASDASENLGSQYTLDLLNKFQLTSDDMRKAFEFCEEQGVTPLCTPWDEVSIDILEGFGLPAYKIASADLTNHDLIFALTKLRKPLILSTGMSTEQEISQAIKILRSNGAQFALLHCNSSYPPPFKDLNLNYIERLKDLGQSVVGYSGHERDIFIACAAVAKGARIIEKHFTEDRGLEGNDHKVSLLPHEFSRMVEGIRQVDESLGDEFSKTMSQGEILNRATLAKSIFAKCNINKGETIRSDMLQVMSPGHGLQPNRQRELVGQVVKRNIKAGEVFYESDLRGEEIVEPREYRFSRPWGIPVRHHDFEKLMCSTNPDMLEFHLSYKDLELNASDYFRRQYDVGLVVHSPELFAGDHTLDLCSPNSTYRQRSVQELQRVIYAAREISQYFRANNNVGIVTNVGGFTEDSPLSEAEKDYRRGLLVESLSELDMEGVEIWPQTMPPYPWHFGGQRFHNLFVEVNEITRFCEEYGMRICLDISHSKLAANYLNISFYEFVSIVSPFVAHMHIADASGLDGEGLQIGEGEIDFSVVSKPLKKYAPDASMIPEIWQGHENNGEGFWRALDKLEEFF